MVFNDHQFHLERIDKYVSGLKRDARNILVPSFDLKTLKVDLKRVSAIIKHPYKGDAYELKLAYGRTVKVTGDHGVFKKDGKGNPVAIPVRQLHVGDHIAIPARLPVVEKDVVAINVTHELINSLPQQQLWEYAVCSKKLNPFIVQKKLKIYEILKASGRYRAKRFNNGIFCAFNKFRSQAFLPLYVLFKLALEVPDDAKIRIFTGGAHIYTPAKIKLSNEILWLLGFYLAEGCAHYRAGKSYFISFCSDEHVLLKAKKILESSFGVHVIDLPIKKKRRGPAIFIHSKILHFVFRDIFKLTKDDGGLRMPVWILQLPLSRLKYVLEGYKDGDGTHSGKKVNKELCFDTVSKAFAQQLNMALLRFGIIASYGLYHTTFKARYGNRRFPFYRLTICELSDFNILKWDKGVRQRLIASRQGDIVWAWIRKIKKCKSSSYVYDFSVPGTENFVAGTGVFCHNTYGPRMRINDGRVVPNFIYQALYHKPLTVYGNGRQTRSFCYIDDLVEGIWRLMWAKTNQPVNLGNPHEFNILTLAKLVLKFTGSQSKIIFKPLPQDDPRQRRPDTSRAKKLLQWQPRVELEEGLKKTIAWFRS